MTQARLSAYAKELLAEIRRCIPDGTWAHISHLNYARRLGRSESTISRCMTELADPDNPFIERKWVEDKGDGRAGYLVSPLPPPELRSRTKKSTPKPPGASFSPPNDDPNSAIPPEGAVAHQDGIDMTSTEDLNILLTHACNGGDMQGFTREQVQEGAEQPFEQLPPTPSARDLPRPPVPLPPVLAEQGLFQHQWRVLQTIKPGYSVEACFVDYGKLLTRYDPSRAFAVLCTALEYDEPVYSQREIDEHLAQYRAQEEQRRAGPPVSTDPPAEEAPARPARQRGRAVPPPEQRDEPELPPRSAPPPGPPREALERWNLLRPELVSKLGLREFNTHFTHARLRSWEAGHLVLETGSRIWREGLERHAPLIERLALRQLGEPVKVEIVERGAAVAAN